MADGGLIVGYLTAALLRGGKRVADRAVDSLLDRLTDLVAGRMGSGPLDRLKRQPGEETVQREVGLTIDGATSVDANFASELAGLVAELDQRGGRQMINEVYAQMNVQAFDHGVAIGRDFNYFNAPGPTDMSDAPGWVKFCVSVGMLVAFTGMFIFGYTILTSIPDVDNPDFGVPPGIPIGFGVAFLGIFIVGIARSWLDEPAPVTASTLRAVWAIATLPRPRRPDQPAPCSRTCVRAGPPWNDRADDAMAGKPAILDDAPKRRVTFPDLVRIHFRWRQALREDSGVSEEERARLDRDYHEALACFEDEHGEMVNAYWCADVESAVALTAGKPNSGWIRRLLSVSPRFHRVSDWATRDEPDIARALHHCDELAIRAGEVLRGRSRRIAIQLVMTSACHLLSLIDARGENPPQMHKAAVVAELRELAEVGQSYRQSANADAQLVYFAGMAIGIAGLVLLYAVTGSVLDRKDVAAETIVGCLVAGAVGAVVSVIARVNSGSFALDEDIARGYTLFLGSLRPWIGSIFGLLIYFAVTADIVQLFEVPADGTRAFYFFCVLAFAAGFSERWAQDTLTGGLGGRGREKADDDAGIATQPAILKGAPPPPATAGPARTLADAEAKLDAS